MKLRYQFLVWAVVLLSLAGVDAAAIVLSRRPPFTGVVEMETLSVLGTVGGIAAAVVAKGDWRLRAAVVIIITGTVVFKLFVLYRFLTEVD